MKKIALILLCLMAASPAQATVSCSLPFNLQNATTADATQVMANYNAIVACLGNAAIAGANNDITSLTAISTPLTKAQGGTPVYTGGTSTGSANVQVVASVSPTNFSLVAGSQVTFKAGFSNTGPTTLNVNSTGNTNVFRRTQLGISAMVGGEIVANHSVTVIYDGTQFQIVGGEPVQVGQGREFFGTSAPAGWALADGSCQLRAGVFADLFSVIGTAFDPTGSTCDVAHFAMPDARGRVMAGKDNMGGVAANRIGTVVTDSGTIVGATLGSFGGSSTHAQSASEMASHDHSYRRTQVTVDFTVQDQSLQPGASVIPTFLVGGTVTSPVASTTAAGSGTAMSLLPPMQIVNKIVKY